jgi:hypothetical protein
MCVYVERLKLVKRGGEAYWKSYVPSVALLYTQHKFSSSCCVVNVLCLKQPTILGKSILRLQARRVEIGRVEHVEE